MQQLEDKRSIGSGNVHIQLLNKGVIEEHTLRPSIHAMKTLSRRYGGLNEVINKIGKLDFDAVAEVIELGIGAPPTPKSRDELAAKLYETGFTDDTGGLPTLCINYVLTLLRGGRPPNPNGEDTTEGNPPRA